MPHYGFTQTDQGSSSCLGTNSVSCPGTISSGVLACLAVVPKCTPWHTPMGTGMKFTLPPAQDIHHLYVNPDAAMEFWKDHNQLNHETAVVHTVMRMSIRPRVGGLESLTTVEIWLLHLLRSAQPVDIVDLMIGEMQDTILTIRRRLPYAPYLIRLFDKKGWLEDGMKKALDQHLKPYKAPRPDDKRRLKNRALQHDKSYKAPKPDDKRRLVTRSLPAHMEVVFDDDGHVVLDHALVPSIQEQALWDTTNGEADTDHGQHMAPPPVPDEFRFGQLGAHYVEAGGLAGHTYDVPPMLQRQIDRQTAILEQMQRQIDHQTAILEQMQGQRQIDPQTAILEQMQRQIDRQTAILEQMQRQRQIDPQTAILEQMQRQMQDIRNLAVVSIGQSIRRDARHSDILALLDESFSASCGL
ncbi:uncharacterized protein LOC119307582 [Triticum dicoccoides]|uniref:uncharacterized protein LOC119307582 n=1 Tax=Triticum dicoccoides TaxID=85692 RepID=UPI00188E264D|nr:uncharacterized protein LOC119307582 [Triticum dicoccoides]